METFDNTLNFKISTSSLLKYAFPTILSNIFMNIYSIVDQLFVSNLLGTDALSAVSIAGPFLAIALAIGTMIAMGGCALVSNQMGEGNNQKARENFSFFMLFCIIVSSIFCLIGILLRHPLLFAMGADETLYPLCEAYAVPIFVMIPFAMASIILQIFLVAAGKPGLGFGLSIAGGVTNIILDYVLLAVIPLGVSGAAYASAAGYILQTIIGIIYFFADCKGSLYFVRPRFDGHALLKACSNGMSEMVSMLAVTITMIAMNVILMNLAGSDGIAAVAVTLSVQTILSSAYAGYIHGITPVISFHYGTGSHENLKKIYQVALRTIAVMSVITFFITFPLAKPIALLFASESEAVMQMAVRGTFIFAGAFLLMGFNLFGSGFFSALNAGKTSAILSLFRTLIFLMIPLMILPPFLGVDGVWISMPAAEVFSIFLSIFYFKKMKSKYHYA